MSLDTSEEIGIFHFTYLTGDPGVKLDLYFVSIDTRRRVVKIWPSGAGVIETKQTKHCFLRVRQPQRWWWPILGGIAESVMVRLYVCHTRAPC